jgi:AraC-like DNA-binding protein
LIDYLLLPRKSSPASLYMLLGFAEKLHTEMANPKGYSRYRANLHLMQIIELLAESLLTKSHMDSSVPASYLTYRHTVNYLEEYYMQALSRERMETSLGKTYEYICQVFKKHSGMNITAYMHQLRMQRAKYLFDNTPRTIAEIALEVGYQDAFYFTRIFKKHEGVTPTHYRLRKLDELNM